VTPLRVPRPPREAVTVTAAVAAAAATAAVAGVALLAAEALEARRRIGRQRTAPPYADGRYGSGRGTSVRLAILGDSGAAGLGADNRHDTMGAVIAAGVADATRRGVVLQNHAVVGALTRDLPAQIERALWSAPQVAIIFVGANDVTHLVPRSRSARQLGAAVTRLREAGSAVVVGTCPDLGTVRPIPQPLRAMMRRHSRRLAVAQRAAAEAAGARVVVLGTLLGPEFDASPDVMFSADRFHPSAEGYSAAGHALLPDVLACLREANDVGRPGSQPLLPTPLAPRALQP
jgi:lysophospholipase L1-like esterase